MASTLSPEVQVDWDAHIKAYLSSGLSMKKYCQQKKLVHHRFQYQWDRYRRDQKKQQLGSKSFAKVALPPAHELKHAYELRCSNGIRCTFPPGLDNVHVIRLIEALNL